MYKRQGYNGAPRGLKHCVELGGCLREKLKIPSGQRHELCRALHAEQNAIIQAATLGQSIEDGTIYITHQPCAICAKMIINAGLKRIVVKEGYPDDLSVEILDEAGLKIVMPVSYTHLDVYKRQVRTSPMQPKISKMPSGSAILESVLTATAETSISMTTQQRLSAVRAA